MTDKCRQTTDKGPRTPEQAVMNVIGVIPARWASTRFPGKSLTPLYGKPLIHWVVERALQAERLTEVLVATDDSRIREAAERVGCRVIMTRSDHPSGTDRVAEAVNIVGSEVDGVVNIQGDEPLIDPVLIDELVDVMVSEPCWDMVSAASPFSSEEAQSTSVNKVVFSANGQALYFSRLPIPYLREKGFHASEPLYWRHIGIYLYRTAFLTKLVAEPPCLLEKAECLEQLRALHLGGRIKIIRTDHVGIGVDTPDDVRKVESEIKRLGLC